MAQKRTGGSSGINNDIKSFADSIMKMVDESNQNSQINKTIEVVAKTKGVSATTQEIRELNKEISSIKKNLKDGDITEEMYANSAKLNESVKSNVKILEEFQKKAKDKKNNLLEFNIGDTKKFYETYYTLEEQLSKMGKEMPNKFKQTFNDIQKNSKAIFKGSAQQINDYYDLSLDELKATAIKRANRGMTDVVSEIKSQYKANAETKIAESISKRDKLVAANSSSASVQNLKKLNELGFTNKGEIDRSKVLFNNYSQCEKVIESIRENLSKISSEDSEKNIEVIKSANTLLAELETRLTNLGETNSFERQSLATQEHINNLFSSGKIDDNTVSSSKEQLESLRQEVDKGEITAEQAANAYSSYCEQLVETARAAQETDEALRKVNSVLWKSMNSQGEFKTWKEMFQQGDVNDKTISKLEKAVSVLRENSSNLDFNQYNKLLKAEDLLYELRNVQEGISDYSNDYNAHYNNSEKIIQNAQESADATREEARSFEAVEETASEAATSKEKFVEANKEVFDSIVNTLKWLGDEDEGFRSLANNLNTALNQFGDFSSSSNFTNFIEALDKIIQKIDEVATKTGKIGLNLNIKNDSTMEAQQAAQATDAYYGTILSRMRTKAQKIETNMPNVATLLFENPRVSDVSKRYNDVLSDAQEALSLGNIDKVGRSNEENVKSYLQYFEQLRTARDNVKRILSEYKQMIKTGVDAEGRTLSEEDKSAITQMIAEYKEQWSFLLSNGALPSYTVNEVSKKVNEINGVTSMGKQSAADKRKKTGNSIAEMLGIDQTDTEGTNIALEKIVNTLEEIRGILSSISQKDVFGELFDDKNGRLDTIATKITNIIQKVKELNAVSGTSIETTSATSSDTGIFANEGKADIEAYTESIKEGESKVEDSVSDVMESGVESGKDTLSIHSPSVVYRIMGQNSMEGYILGVEDKKFEVMNAVGDVLKSGFLNNEADSKWLTDWWTGLTSKDTFSIEQLDLLPDTQNYIKDAFNADINSRVIDENNLTNALRNTALAVRNVAEANEERIRTEKELSAEVERVYEGEFVQEGQRSSRNMKRTKVADGLYEYEEEISPGRKRRYQERFNTKTQQWDQNEIISTDYDKLVSEAVDATIKLTKAQHDLNIEQSKQSPNIDFIMEYNAQIREAQERLDRATLSASNFAQEVVRIVNDPAYDTKYVMGMFNDAVNEQSFFKLSDENIRFYGKLRRENESTQKSIDATTKALAVFENQVRNVEYSYDQTLSPGITKPVTRQSDLDELTTKRDEILTRINNLKGTSATVQDITDIRKLINEYQLLAKAKRDANNVVDKNLGGETLEVKVSKQIANIDKLIAKSEQYGDATKDITDKLKQQKQALENTITTDPTSGKTSTSIEAKDFYDIQSNVKILGSQLDSNIVKLKEQKKLVNEYLKAYANQQKSLNKIQVLQEEGEAQNKNAIAAETQKMQKAAKELQKVENTLKNQGFDFSSIQNEIDTINAEKGEIIGKYYDQVNTKNYKNLNTDYLSLDKITQSGDKYTDSFITKVNTLKAELRALMDQGLDFNNQDAKAKLDEIRQKVEAIKSEAKFDDVQLALNNTIEKTKLKISKFMSENSAMTDEYRSKLQDLEVRLNGADLTKAEVNSIVDSFIRLETEITKAGKTGKSFFATITDRLKGLNAQLIARYLSIYDIIRYTRTAVSTIKELDTQLVDLRKTTTMTSSELEKFYGSSSDVAKQMGVTTSEIISQAAAWSRLGYSSNDAATKMAELSSQFASISPNVNVEDATDYLVSAMKAFGKTEDDVERSIMDNVNAIGNTMATTNGEIGEMLERSSAAMAAANNTIEQTIALESAAVEVTRNAETTGTAFRTISMRIRGYDENSEDGAEELSEDLENISGDIADLTKINGKGGISIFTDKNRTEYKSTYQILKEISEIWDELTDKQQADLLEKLGGKRGAQSLAHILEDFDSVENALKTMENAAGSADAEMAIIEDSIEYKLNSLKQTWTGVLTETIDRSALSNILTGLTTASEKIGGLVTDLGLLKTAIIGVSTVIGSKRLGLLNYTKGDNFLSGFGGIIGNGIKNLAGARDTTSFLAQIDEYGVDNLSEQNIENFANGYDRLNPKALQYVQNVKAGNIQLKEGQTILDGYRSQISILNEIGLKFSSLGKNALNIIGKISSTLVNGVASALISYAIVGIISKLNDLRKELGYLTKGELASLRQEIIETGEAASSAISQTSEDLANAKETVSEVGTEYAKLAQGVKDLGLATQSQGKLSNDDYERFLELSNQLSEVFPSLKVGITDEGDALLSLNGSTKTITESLQSLLDVETELASQQVRDKLPDIWAAYGINAGKASKEYNAAKNKLERYNELQNIFQANPNETWNSFLINYSNYDEMVELFDEAGLGDFDDYLEQKVGSLDFKGIFDNIISKYQIQIRNAEQTIESENQKLGSIIALSLQGNIRYDKLDESSKNVVNQTLANLHYDSDYNELRESEDWDQVYTDIQNRVLNAMSRLEQDSPELAERFNESYNKIFNFEGSDDTSIKDYLSSLQYVKDTINNLNTDDATKNAMLAALPNDEEVQNKISHLKELMGENWSEDILSEFNAEDLELLTQIGLDEDSVSYTKEQLLEELKKLQEEADNNVIQVRTNAGAAENLDAMKDAFDDLSTAYFASVKNQDSSGNATNNIASAEDIQGVNDAFGGITEINTDTQVTDINTLNNALEAYDSTLIENKGDAEKAQAAADQLATAYVDLSDVLDNLTEENKDYYIEQLKANGITNAEEVVNSRLSKQYQKTRSALEKLSQSVAKNRKYLDAGVDAGQDYEDAIADIKADVQDLLTVYDDSGKEIEALTPEIDSSFITENLADIEAATEGDIDALNRLRLEIARVNASKAYVDVSLPSDVVEAQLDNLMDKVAEVDAMDIEVGASVDDTAFIAALQNMITSGQTTADAVSAAFESMGYNVEWVPHPYTVTYVQAHETDIKDSKAYNTILKKAQETIDMPSLKITKASSATGAKVNGYSGGSSPSSGSGDSGDSGSDSSDDETFDWIEVAIDRLENNLDKLSETIDDVYDTWQSRNEAISKSIDEVNKEIELQEQGAARYLEEANNVDLAEEWKKKVREGKLDIDTVSDSDLADNIKEYQTWWEKYQDAMDKSKTLTQTIKEYYKTLFDNVATQYEQLLDTIADKSELIDERISRMEEHGYFVDANYYKQQQTLETQNNKKLVEEREALMKKLEEAVKKGTIKKGSEAWQEMYNKIQEVNKSIEESKTKMVELANTLQELRWSKFEWVTDRLSDISEEASFLQGLLQNRQQFQNDITVPGETKKYSSGKFTNAGMASAALILAQYDQSIAAARNYESEIADINNKLANDPNNTKLIEQKEELIKKQREQNNTADQLIQTYKSLVQEAINKNVEALEALISKYEESLSAAKDLYDYQKNVTDQTKNIISLEKQLAAYKYDTSEESRKKQLELQQQLDDARTGLKETQWDKYISETNDMLSDMSEDYQAFLNSKLDDLQALIKAGVDEINANKDAVEKGLQEITKEYGITTQNFESWRTDMKKTTGDIVTAFNNGWTKANASILQTYRTLKSKWTGVTNTNDNANGATSANESGRTVKGDTKEAESKNVKSTKEGLTVFTPTSDITENEDTNKDKTKNTDKKKETKNTYKPKNAWYKGYWYDAKGKKDPKYHDGKIVTDSVGQWFRYVDDYKDPTKYTWLENTNAVINGKRYYFDKKGYIIQSKTKAIKGYATGKKRVPTNQNALTNEHGSELIYRTDSGAILTPLNQGDMVFTNEMSQRLWEIAKGDIPTSSTTVPHVNTTINSGDANVNAEISITLPNVQNYSEFKKELQNDNNFEKFIQEITIGQLNGNNTLNKRKY